VGGGKGAGLRGAGGRLLKMEVLQEQRELEVTVAMIANPDDPHRNPIPGEEWERPYNARPKVRLIVSSSASLADVMNQASDGFGVVPPPGWEFHSNFPASRRIAFYKDEDEVTFAPRALPRLHWGQLVLVDEQGGAVFGVYDQRAVTFEDLIRASEAGVLDGDPLRPYLMVEPGWGDAPPPDWPTVLIGLKVTWDVLEHVAVTGGVLAFADLVLERLKSRLQKGRKAVQSHREWAQRGTRPYQFTALILTRDWSTRELAGLLGCTDSEAEAVLWILGFSFDEESQRWLRQGDIEGSLVTAIQEQIAIASHRGGADWEDDLRRRIIELLERGKPPAV
jgi:hypothetical protein